MNEINEYISLVESNLSKAREVSKSSEFWKKILNEYPDYKNAVTLNKNLPDVILSLLSRDPDPGIRLDVSNKRRLPIEVFSCLSKDENESVRLGIACNPKTPFDILEGMKNDDWDEIVIVIDKRLQGRDA